MFNRITSPIMISICALIVVVSIHGCKDEVPGPVILEPITFFQPDTTTISAAPGAAISLSVQLTTDRIIDTLRITFHIDSLMMGYDESVDPSFTYKNVGWADSSNVQTYTDVYTVPTTVESFDVIRLFFSLEAKERFYQKTLKINVQ